MYQLQEASKLYRTKSRKVLALGPTTLGVAGGEFVAVVGSSGSGKTTMLSMLGGMMAPSSGKVWFDGRSLYDAPVRERARLRREHIGFVFQTFNLIPYLSAVENVQVPLMLSGAAPADQQGRAADLLERVGLEPRLHHRPCELSTGQQQRVALARTLANDPRVILADEPTGNLDPESRQRILAFLEDFCRGGRTVIMVTHDPLVAARAGRVIRLEEGVVVSDSGFATHRAA